MYPHEQKVGYWCTSRRQGRYQAILLDKPNVILKAVSSLNLATLPPYTQEEPVFLFQPTRTFGPTSEGSTPGNVHWWKQLNGSRTLKSCYAILTLQDVLEVSALPPGISAQRAEIITITRVLHWGNSMKVTIYTDSKYAFQWSMLMEPFGKRED